MPDTVAPKTTETVIPVAPEWAKRAHIDAAKYQAMVAAEKSDPVAFWANEAKRLAWIKAPTKIKDVKPIYPDTMRASGTAGKVLLKATIATDGTVRDVQVVKSVHPDLDNAAVEAVRQWLFDGTMLNCNPVDVTMNVSIDFGIGQ